MRHDHSLDVLWVGEMGVLSLPPSVVIHRVETVEEALARVARLNHDLAVVHDPQQLQWAPVLGEAPMPVLAFKKLAMLPQALEAIPGAWWSTGDPDLEPLREAFLVRLAARLQTLDLAMNTVDFVTLDRLSHQVAGTASLYGLPSVGWESAALCRSARAQDAEGSRWHLRRVLRATPKRFAAG